MIPTLVRRGIRRSLGPILPALRQLRRLPAALRSRDAARDLAPSTLETDVCYLTPAFPAGPPAQEEHAYGGIVKMTAMARYFPHAFPTAAVVYGVSSVPHPDASDIVNTARRRGLRFVLNQNGVYYRGWFGDAWREYNRPLATLLHRADFIIYQSEFCRRAAEEFLGVPDAAGCVLYNPVDLAAFRPRTTAGRRPLTLLAAGVGPHRSHEVETVVETLRLLRRSGEDAQLVLAGYSAEVTADAEMMHYVRALAVRGGMPQECIRFLRRYSRPEAPSIFAQGDLFLHPVYNDASPNVVGEALASGLPVVYSASGGTPEIVGLAGIGLPAREDWEVRHAPVPEELADAVRLVAKDLPTFAALARRQAESKVDLDTYIQAHRAILRQLGTR